MKQAKALATFVVVALIAGAVFNLYRTRVVAEAQEPPRELKADPPKDGELGPDAFGWTTDRPYPVFCIDDVLVRLTTVAEELIDKNVAKNSEALRKDLERTQFTMTLPRPSTKELSPQELYRRACESVFLVAGLARPEEEGGTDWQTSFSSAFVVHEDGILSTSAHVFDHEDKDHAVVVLDNKGHVHPIVEVVAFDRDSDTCLFRIAVKGLKPLPLGKDAPPGSPIRVMGHPGDSFFFFSAGVIANYERDSEGRTWLNVTADFGQGSSGGPALDTFGNVIGQVSRTYTLFAGGEASRRKKRLRTVRQADAAEPAEVPMEAVPKELHEVKRQDDPQMTFKACTPVSAIRALVK